jgi:hypothetical protein
MFSVPDFVGAAVDAAEENALPPGEPPPDALHETAELTLRSRQAEVARNLERGQNEVAAGRPDQAVRFYERVLRDDPKNFEALHRLAVLADTSGDFLAAERSYLRALEGHSNDSDLLNDLGYSYLLQERFAEAEQTLRRALALNPGHELALANLGLLYRQVGDDARAVAISQTSNSRQAPTAIASENATPRSDASAVKTVAVEFDDSDESRNDDSFPPLPLWTPETSGVSVAASHHVRDAREPIEDSGIALLTPDAASEHSGPTAADAVSPIVLTGHVLPGGRMFPTVVLQTPTGVTLPTPRWSTSRPHPRAE